MSGDGLAEPVDGAVGEGFLDGVGQPEAVAVGVRVAAQFRPTVIHRDGRIEVESNGFQERLRLQRLAAVLDLLDVSSGRHVERPLGNDRPLIEVGRHVVGRHARDPDPLVSGLPVGLRAGERGQKRGMDVDDPILIAEDDVGAQDPHVAGQHDQISVVLVEEFEQPFLVGGALLVADVVEIDAVVVGQRLEVVVIADDNADIGPEFPVGPRLEQRLETV